MSTEPLVVPPDLVAWHAREFGDAGRPWIDSLPLLVESRLDAWNLVPDGPPGHGRVALVLPVLRSDGMRAALKCQPVDDESVGEPAALRVWNGDGAVRLLDHDPATGTMLLERLDGARSLHAVDDDVAATRVLAGLLRRLVTAGAPEGLRDLGGIARAMVDAAPSAVEGLPDAGRRLLLYCADVVAELVGEPGSALLHWDLHYGNVLAAEREPWLAIDPKPLTGDPGFELLPALHNRWEDLVATGEVSRAVRYRFDLMVDALGLDRRRAIGWTMGRVLQDALWDIEDGFPGPTAVQVTIVEALRPGCIPPGASPVD